MPLSGAVRAAMDIDPVRTDSRRAGSRAILMRVSGTNQHYLPAALIGGFGRPVGRRLRDAQVAVRRKPGGAVHSDFPAAETLAFRPGMYTLASGVRQFCR